MHVAGLQELGKRLKAERERQRVLQAEHDSAAQAMNVGNLQLGSLDEQIETLRAQLDKLETERRALQEQQPLLLEQAAAANHARHANEKIRLSLEHQEPELASQKTAAEEQLFEARCRAFSRYVREAETQLVSFQQEHLALEAVRLRRAEFERVRHEDHGLMAAWEQYEEYGKLLALAGVPAVKTELERRRADAKAVIEHRYPGALSDAAALGGPSDVSQLYWMPDDNPSRTRFFLPITAELWRRTSEGNLDIAGETALWLVWGVCSHLATEGIHCDLQRDGNWVVLLAEAEPKYVAVIDSVPMQLKSGGIASLEVQSLPDIVKEALLKTHAIP